LRVLSSVVQASVSSTAILERAFHFPEGDMNDKCCAILCHTNLKVWHRNSTITLNNHFEISPRKSRQQEDYHLLFDLYAKYILAVVSASRRTLSQCCGGLTKKKAIKINEN